MSNTTQVNRTDDFILSASDEIAILRKQVATLAAERDTLQLRVDGLEAQMATIRNSWVHKSINDLAAENTTLRDELAELRRDYAYRGQFIETMLQQPAPVAAQPAATVRMDSYGAFTSSVSATRDEDQKCEACDGDGEYTTSICGEWTRLDCPDCKGLGAKPGTALYQERAAKRAADLEAARNAPIPF